MKSVIIRTAKQEDIPAMAALWHEKLMIQQQMDRRFRILPDGQAAWMRVVTEWLVDSSYVIYVAEQTSTIVGYLIGRVEAGPPGLSPAQVGAVIDVAVGAHSDQNGLGRRLLSPVRDHFAVLGITQVRIYAPCRQPVEQAFWRALGATKMTEILWMKL